MEPIDNSGKELLGLTGIHERAAINNAQAQHIAKDGRGQHDWNHRPGWTSSNVFINSGSRITKT